MPYTFSQHVPWWNEIANQVVDLGGNPITGTIPAGSSVVTGSSGGGLQGITSGSFGPAPIAITASYTANLTISAIITSSFIVNSLIDLAVAIGAIADPESTVAIPSETDGAIATADVRDATSTATPVPNISSVVDPALAQSDTRDATSTATPVPNISSVVDPALANSDVRDISSVIAIPQPLDRVTAFADVRDAATTQLLSGYIRRWNANVGVTTGATFTWADEFGNNATQSTGSAQPTTTTVGGKNAIAFDGTNDLLVTNTATYAAKTIIIVFKLDRIFTDYDGLISMRTGATKCATSNEDIICVGYPQDGGTTKLNGSTDNASDIVYVNGVSGSRSNFNNFAPGGGGVPTGGFGTSAMQCIAFTRNNSSSGSKTFTIGAECILSRWLQGKISEIIIYDTVLTGAQLANIYTDYIKPTWGTP